MKSNKKKQPIEESTGLMFPDEFKFTVELIMTKDEMQKLQNHLGLRAFFINQKMDSADISDAVCGEVMRELLNKLKSENENT